VPARVEAMRRRVETAGAASPPQRERRADVADGRPRGDGPPRAA
jgi:hypothetical protein